tara:strand:+ start:583 stop:828 length:246 start_codon:yes stop_codon:yes gene_type:complete
MMTKRRKRTNFLDFNRPRTIAEIRSLWFVRSVYTDRANSDGWWIGLELDYLLNVDETSMIHEETLKYAIERLDDVYKGKWD